MKNSYKKGSITLFIYPESNKFVGVCLELDIVEEGNDLEWVKNSLLDATRTHVEIVVKNKLSETLLNRPAPKEYWDKFFNYIGSIELMRKNNTQYESKPVLVTTLPFEALSPC